MVSKKLLLCKYILSQNLNLNLSLELLNNYVYLSVQWFPVGLYCTEVVKWMMPYYIYFADGSPCPKLIMIEEK